MKKIFFIFILTALTISVNAQEKGFLRGNVQDGEFGGALIGATIVLADKPGVGVVTDFDGNYSLPLDPGTYTIRMSFISFQTLTFPDVEIVAGEVTVIDAEMKSAIDELDAVEITETVRRNNEAGMLMEMKNAANLVDGMSAQTFRKVGDSDLSGALKRVNGVTVQAGKYVYVRGLGDRYTKTTLNGMSIPGLDPDVNSVQIDIFPTSILENVAVFKSASPNLYGDFTGGLVNVVTKDFPDEKQSQISVGVGYIPGQTFNDQYITYDGGRTDWLGFDDGARELPINRFTQIPAEPLLDPALERITRSFNPTLAARQQAAAPNASFSFTTGNQINKENGATWGYNFVLNYKNETNFYDDFQANTYLKDDDLSINDLFRDESRIGVVGTNEVLWSALGSVAYKKGSNSFSAMVLRSQSGESASSQRKVVNRNQTGAILLDDILTYTQRELSTFFLSGKHKIDKLQIDWSNAFTISRVYEPDFRTTSFSITTGDTTLIPGDGAGIDRFWRELNEINENFSVDLIYDLNSKLDLKAGANLLLRWREFETLSYKHDRRDRAQVVGDPDWFLQPENIWTPNDRSGTFTIGNFEPANTFDGRQNVFGAYLMAQQAITPKLKAIYGARFEQGLMYYTGQNNSGTQFFDDERTLDEFNVLPSLNLVYALNDDMNLRASTYASIARPSIKEKSIAQIIDPITNRTFAGNIDLNQTEIWNYDLRWEWFFGARELLSIAGFYKQFDGHIELVAFETRPDELKPRNSGDADVLGFEIEIRKTMGFLSNSESKILNRLFLGGNFTLVRSRVDMTQVFTQNSDVDGDQSTELELRQRNARDGETIDQFRLMAGQSPFAINANLAYEILERQMSISLAYNVQGEQLSVIASGRRPDVYTIPFHSLDFNAYYSFGEGYNSRITFGVQNILDDDITQVYRSFGASGDEIFQSFRPGTQLSLKYSYTF